MHKFLQLIGSVGDKSNKYYLVYMAMRLLEMKRILKDTGSIYLHCDSTMGHYLKLLMDVIFGHKNFRNEIIWRRTNNPKGSQYKEKIFGVNTDSIFFYSKTEDAYLNIGSIKKQLSTDELHSKYSSVDEYGRYYKGPIECGASMGARPNLCYEYKGYSNKYASGWRMTKENLEELDKKGNLGWSSNNRPYRKLRLEDDKGHPIYNLWTDISRVSDPMYPTQKPLKLLERIIKSSCPENGIVLDPFCGCATTCVAAEKLDREWIGIDISEKAFDLVIQRLGKEVENINPLFIKKVDYQTETPLRTDIEELSNKEKIEYKKYLYGHQQGICSGCKVRFQINNLTIDHIHPKIKGGTDTEDNLQLLCHNCNSIKGKRPMSYLIDKINKIRDIKNNF